MTPPPTPTSEPAEVIAAPSEVDSPATRPSRVVTGTAALVDGAVVAFAWFTVLAHLWDILNLSVTPLLVCWLVTLPLPLYGVSRLRSGPPAGPDERPAWLRARARWSGPRRQQVLAFAGLVVVGAALMAVPNRTAWRIGWVVCLVAVAAALLALVVTMPGRGQLSEDGELHPRGTAWSLLVAGVAGVAFGLFNLFAITPNGDDSYYVNRVAWIARHGTIPDRDTMFSHNVLPPLFHPVIGTYETFAGALGHVLGISGGGIEYLVLGPVIAALTPIVIWRAMLPLRLRRPLLGMLAIIAFLLLTARGEQWFGMMVLRRAWQTKELLAAGMIPLLLGYLTMTVTHRGRRPWALLVAGTIAALGFSSSAAALVPLLLVAGGIAGYLLVGRRVVVPVALSLFYPLLCLLAYRMSGSSSALTKTNIPHYKIPYAIWQWFIGDRVVGFVAAAAIVCGFLGYRSRAGRLIVGAASGTVVLALAPKLLETFGSALAGAATAWRVIWIAPLPILVAGLVCAVDGLAVRVGGIRARHLAPAIAAVLLVAGVATETPLTSAKNTKLTASPHWDVDQPSLHAARRLAKIAPVNSIVAGPVNVSFIVPIATTRVFSLNARTVYAQPIAAAAGPHFRFDQRVALTRWLTGFPIAAPTAEAAQTLRSWPVSALCVTRRESPAGVSKRVTALTDAGYVHAGHDGQCVYLKLPSGAKPG